MSAARDTNLQDPYLNDLRKRHQSVVIYLSSGIRQTGIIGSFDRHAVALRQGENTILIYKHMIASIVPAAKAVAPRFQEPEVQTTQRPPAPAQRPPTVIVRKVTRKTY